MKWKRKWNVIPVPDGPWNYDLLRACAIAVYLAVVLLAWSWIDVRNDQESWHYRSARDLNGNHRIQDSDLLEMANPSLAVRVLIPGREQWAGRYLVQPVKAGSAILPTNMVKRPVLALRAGGRPFSVEIPAALAENLSAGDLVRVMGPDSCDTPQTAEPESKEAEATQKKTSGTLDLKTAKSFIAGSSGESSVATESHDETSSGNKAPKRELARGVRLLSLAMEGGKHRALIELFHGHSDVKGRIACGLTLELE